MTPVSMHTTRGFNHESRLIVACTVMMTNA